MFNVLADCRALYVSHRLKQVDDIFLFFSALYMRPESLTQEKPHKLLRFNVTPGMYSQIPIPIIIKHKSPSIIIV